MGSTLLDTGVFNRRFAEYAKQQKWRVETNRQPIVHERGNMVISWKVDC